jgi:hypothetical protein
MIARLLHFDLFLVQFLLDLMLARQQVRTSVE